MKGIVYLTGRMRGMPLFNFPAFDAAAERLAALGWDVINPAELDRRHGLDPTKLPSDWDWNELPPEFDRDVVARRDVAGVFSCTHYAQITKDMGLGTRAEVALCEWLGRQRIDPMNGEHWQPEGILEEAVRVTSGQRRADYDHALPNHERIAMLWNSYLMVRKDARGQLSPLDVAQMMILLKMARIAHRPTRDGFTDIAGYARCGSQIEGFEP